MNDVDTTVSYRQELLNLENDPLLADCSLDDTWL